KPVALPRLDAAVLAQSPQDAPKPEAETVKVHFESIPSGATIQEEDGRMVCQKTPCDFRFVVHDKEVNLVAQLPGYVDGHFSMNPYAQKDQPDPVTVKLKKATGAVPVHKGSGSAAVPVNHAGGELSGYHYEGSGNVPKK